MSGPEALVPIVVVPVVFGTIFAIVYIIVTARNRERMSLIEHGMTANVFDSRHGALKWGLMSIGLGLGLLLGDILNQITQATEEKAPLYVFAMMLVCGGGGLLTYYKMVGNKGKTE